MFCAQRILIRKVPNNLALQYLADTEICQEKTPAKLKDKNTLNPSVSD